jgi:hypothetical protein
LTKYMDNYLNNYLDNYLIKYFGFLKFFEWIKYSNFSFFFHLLVIKFCGPILTHFEFRNEIQNTKWIVGGTLPMNNFFCQWVLFKIQYIHAYGSLMIYFMLLPWLVKRDVLFKYIPGSIPTSPTFMILYFGFLLYGIGRNF